MRYFVFILTVLISSSYFAQTPTNCFEITSILVDGCAGSEEGQNEMVGLRIGPNPIDVNDLRIDGAGASGTISENSWPNNPFLGFCTSPQATANLQILNDAILQCGQLLEPPGGILPAGANVIIITSTDFQPITSYFENLTETLYVVFQCAGNTAGHFVNFGSGANNNRSLVIHHIPSSCADTVSYDRTQLLNASGVLGAQDGGAVAFDFENNPTYFNNGCQAPFTPANVTIVGQNNINNQATACLGGTINLTGIITGDFSNFTWSGGNGTFSNPNSLITDYILGAGETGQVTISLTVETPCNPTLVTNYQFTIEEPFVLPISSSPSGIITLCDGASQTVTASGGAGVYSWSTGETGTTISVSQAGTYTITSENACETETHDFEVITGSSAILTSTIVNPTCIGDCDATATVNINGIGNYSILWGANANNATINSVTGLCQGTYNCTVTDGLCPSTIDILITDPTPISLTSNITNTTCSNTCDGALVITGNGGLAPYSITVSDDSGNIVDPLINLCSGDYVVTIQDAENCSNIAQTLTIEAVTPIEYTKSNDQLVCQNETIKIGITITQGNPSILWSTNQQVDSIIVQGSSSQNYIFTLSEGTCMVQDTIKITSNACEFGIIFPNIFTPNGDLANDFYVPIEFAGVKNVNFSILNRWGEIMYESNTQDIKWDGKVNGNDASEGVYFYKIIYFEGISTEEKEMHGFLHLERK